MNFAAKALPLWGLEGAKITLIAARENSVYRVDHPTGSFAMRLHRQGYRTDDQLKSELDWMAWVAQSGLSVPAPQVSLDGSHLHTVDGVQIDVLNWLTGDTLEVLLPQMDKAARTQLFQNFGRDIAKMHDASDAWPGVAACVRPTWDVNGLLGRAPLWDRFWDNPHLTAKQRELFVAFRAEARSNLDALAASLDYGLIHADLVPANVMVQGSVLHFIDFDDGGFGFRLFEVATALLKHCALPDFEILKVALITGYQAHRQLDVSNLGLFLALRAMTYVGWNISRAEEDKTGERNARFVGQAEVLATAYLDR
ncbi:MAG: phosphotransferase [Paracoccaceae bacterium]